MLTSFAGLVRYFGMPALCISNFQVAFFRHASQPHQVHTFPTRRSSDLTRLKLTLRGKRLGLALSEIRELIDMYEPGRDARSEEHTSELQSRLHIVCRLLLDKKTQDRDLISHC